MCVHGSQWFQYDILFCIKIRMFLHDWFQPSVLRYVILMRKNMLLCYSSSPQQGFIHLLRQIKEGIEELAETFIEKLCTKLKTLRAQVSHFNNWKSWSSILDSRACELKFFWLYQPNVQQCLRDQQTVPWLELEYFGAYYIGTTLHTWFRECACLFSSSERPCPRVY